MNMTTSVNSSQIEGVAVSENLSTTASLPGPSLV